MLARPSATVWFFEPDTLECLIGSLGGSSGGTDLSGLTVYIDPESPVQG